MLSVGKMVLYGTNGVCTVEEITVRRIGGTDIEYYVLKPVSAQGSTLYVPVNNQELLGKIRDIISADEARAILDDLPEPGVWNDNKNERIEEFKEIISSGDCRRLTGLIRLIDSRSRELRETGKHLYQSDEKLLREAEKMISEEFSIALGKERDSIIAMITG